MDVEFTSKLIKLEASKKKKDKVDLLKQISLIFKLGINPSLTFVAQKSNLIQTLAEVLKENKEQWISTPQDWAHLIAESIYKELRCNIPLDQTKALLEIILEYLVACEGEFPLSLLFAVASSYLSDISTLFYDLGAIYGIQHVEDIIKQRVLHASSEIALNLLVCLASTNDRWKTRLLDDQIFLLDLLLLSAEKKWALFVLLAKHPDAKTLMPSEVLQKAGTIEHKHCLTMCAALCSEEDAARLKLNITFVSANAKELCELLDSQHIKVTNHETMHNLLFPMANLSVGDANKEVLGNLFISPLKQILSINQSECKNVKINNFRLGESKQLAAKILWNLAFKSENRERIADNNGLAYLKKLQASEIDSTLKENIEGILYMFSRESTQQPKSTAANKKGHIMISYSWDNQPTILRLAVSLKQYGLKVWLDVEQMKGSTLDAMAEAIEGAALVLICGSQRYKDSPNCRLEGEYCVNRKIPYIPLMMQTGYTPEGWLGITFGSKLYYMFANEDGWDAKVAALVKGIESELAVCCVLPEQQKAVDTQPKPKGVETWTPKDIHSWMKAEGIDQFYQLFVEHKIDGIALKELKNQQNLALTIKHGLNIGAFGDVLRISAAVQKL